MAQHETTRLLSSRKIRQAVNRIALEISRDYRRTGEQGPPPLMVGVLKGSFIFLADLVRALEIPVSIDFMQAQSYYATQSTGNVVLTSGPDASVRDRHVILVEDIVDTGTTVKYLLDQFNEEGPASLKVCSLLDKPSRREAPVKIDYLGFTVPEKFVVGYGLDFDQQYRNLPEIYVLDHV